MSQGHSLMIREKTQYQRYFLRGCRTKLFYCTKEDFDEEGRMTHLMNEAGDTIVLLYEEGKLVKVQADMGDYLELEYNEKDQMVRVSAHSGRRILFTYDRKKLTGMTDPLG